ncbi:hypothetical protein D8B35_07240 [Lactococcus laudensis]|nr:hypothetical protein [Lactococcus laudensis]
MKILINQKSQVNWQGLLDSFFSYYSLHESEFFHIRFFYQIGILLAKQCEIGKKKVVFVRNSYCFAKTIRNR